MVITFLLLLVVSIIVSYLSMIEKRIPEDRFFEVTVVGLIDFVTLYFFLPLWIIVFIGAEFANGHVNRYVFFSSKDSYFKSKLIWCITVSAAFSALGLFCLIVCAILFSSVSYFLGDYFTFFLQSFLTSLSLSIILFSITMVVRGYFACFVIYASWSVVEGILNVVVNKYWPSINYLPLQLTTIFYKRVKLSNRDYEFCLPFSQGIDKYLILTLYIFAALALSYRHFSRVSLNPLSD